MKKRLYLFSIFCLAAAITLMPGCGQKSPSTGEDGFSLEFDQYKLNNGLDVIIHEDHSDPIAAVAIQYHVGSNREVPGRTGFAHLFEHMMFQASQHVPQDQFFKKIQEAGGSLNGGTSNDGTVYFEVVPKNSLEMALWLEADRMGFLRPTVTQEAFQNQQGIVKNEKRQVVDNRPYGHTQYILGKLLYPEGHPYSWDVIGSMEDLTNATLADVHEFHEKWYRPNNATLVVAGDIDVAQTKAWIEKYFGEIPSGQAVPDPETQPAGLTNNKIVYFEDNFARSPEMTLVFPTAPMFAEDSYALSFLGQLLSVGKKSPFYHVIVEEKKLAPSVSGFQMSLEISGEFRIRVRAFPQADLDDVKAAIFQALERFEVNSFTEADLDRIKAKTETRFYNGVSGILMRSFQLARYNEYAGSPDYITTDLEKMMSVTREDILEVYQRYIKDKPHVITCFVPQGKVDLALEEAEKYEITVSAETESLPQEQDSTDQVSIEPVKTSFDRSIEPSKGPDPALHIPSIWKHNLDNGISVLGIHQDETPLVQFSLNIKGGHWLDPLDKSGCAHLLARLLMQGTETKTPIELEEAIDDLGANIRLFSGGESMILTANCLSSKFPQVYALVEEILLEPRWDENEFSRLKKESLEAINRGKTDPSRVAMNTFGNLVYGDLHIKGIPSMGTTETINALAIEDLKSYYQSNFSPSISHIAIVGDIDKDTAAAALQSLSDRWQAKEVTFPEYDSPEVPENPKVVFVDIPGARQSVIRIGGLSIPHTHPDYFALEAMNYKLGGSFNSIVNMILREEKGYTYGARTGFSGGFLPGSFSAFSSVQSQATLESVQIFRDSMLKYREGVSPEDLEFTKSALIRSNALRFETLGALLGMLTEIATYNLPDDYIRAEENTIRGMSLEQHRDLAVRYIDPDKMVYLVVGDAAAHMTELEKLGLGKPVLVEIK